MSATPDDRSYEPPPRTKILILEEGQRLETDFVTVIAMRGKDSVELECNCTTATPDTPDCQMSVETIPGGTIRVSCTPVRGCQACSTTVRLPSRGLQLETPPAPPRPPGKTGDPTGERDWPTARMLLL